MTEAHQRGGKVAAVRTTDKAHIAVDGEVARASVRAQELGDHLQGALSGEVRSHLGRHQDGGAHIDGVEHLDDVLPLAVGLGHYRRGIFKIQLPLAHGSWALERLMPGRQAMVDTSGLAQEAIDGATRARQSRARSGQIRIAGQIIQDGLGPRCPPQAFRRLITHLEDAVDHHLTDALRRVLAGARLAVQDSFIIRGTARKRLLHFLTHPCDMPTAWAYCWRVQVGCSPSSRRKLARAA